MSNLLDNYLLESEFDAEPLIQKYSTKYNLDPDILRKQVMQESGGSPYAVSKAGAKGILQLMDGTAGDLGVVDPFDPDENMDGGARYLRQQLDKYKGDYKLALAAYNAGPGNVDKYGGVPPFQETQAYVEKILGADNPVLEAYLAGGDVQPAQEESVLDAYLGEPERIEQPEPHMPDIQVAEKPGLNQSFEDENYMELNYPESTPSQQQSQYQSLGEGVKDKVEKDGPFDSPWTPKTTPEEQAVIDYQKDVFPKQEAVRDEVPLTQRKADPGRELLPGEKNQSMEEELAELADKNDPVSQQRRQEILRRKADEDADIRHRRGDTIARDVKGMGKLFGPARSVTRLFTRYLDTDTPTEEADYGKRYLNTMSRLIMNAHGVEDPGLVESFRDFVGEFKKSPLKMTGLFAQGFLDEIPGMMASGAVTPRFLKAVTTIKNPTKTRKLFIKAGLGKYLKEEVVDEVRDMAVSGYGSARSRGENYEWKDVAVDGLIGGPLGGTIGKIRHVRGSKIRKSESKELAGLHKMDEKEFDKMFSFVEGMENHPKIKELWPAFHSLKGKIEAKIDVDAEGGSRYWSREELDKAGYTDREPGKYAIAGQYEKTGNKIKYGKSAGKETVVEETTHYLQELIRNKNPDLAKRIGDWEADMRSRGLNLPDGDELFGQSFTVHMGYANKYEGDIRRVVIPEDILDDVSEMLSKELKGDSFIDGDVRPEYKSKFSQKDDPDIMSDTPKGTKEEVPDWVTEKSNDKAMEDFEAQRQNEDDWLRYESYKDLAGEHWPQVQQIKQQIDLNEGKKSKGGMEVNEHIDKKTFGEGSDEISNKLGFESENDFMEWVREIPNKPKGKRPAALFQLKPHKYLDGLDKKSEMDDLTNIANSDKIRSEIEDAIKTKKPIMFMDIDDFKAVNDVFDHATGDDVLKGFGEVLREHFPEAKLGRYGGEEFAVVFDKIPNKKRLKAFVDDMHNITAGGEPISISAGIGVGVRKIKGKTTLIADIMEMKAKASGKNQIAIDFDGKREYIKGKGVEKEYVDIHDLQQIEARTRRVLDRQKERSPEVRESLKRTLQVLERDKGRSPVQGQKDKLGDKPNFQLKQTDTPEFKRWFGKSKVVDSDGKPLVVYHGTPSSKTVNEQSRFKLTPGIDSFDQNGPGFYFTTSPDQASGYADGEVGIRGERPGDRKSPGVFPVYISIKNPIKVNFADSFQDNFDFSVNEAKKFIENAPNIRHKEESPLGDWFDSYWDGGPEDWMIDDVSNNYTGVSFWSIYNDFYKSNPQKFLDVLGNITGKDGVVANLKDGTKHYIAWKPEQIKSATGNKGTFDPQNPDIRFSLKKGDTFYSKAEQTAEKMPNKMDPQSLRNFFKKQGVKDDELNWMDFDSFLENKKSVSKADVQEFIQQNKVELKEVKKDESGGTLKFSEYTLPGGKNYQELLITKPTKFENLLDKIDDWKIKAERETGIPQDKIESSHQLREEGFDKLADELHDYEQKLINSKVESNYRSSHYDEPNILAHVRHNERTTPDGKKVLFLEEVQSDWHQEGRKKGYVDEKERKNPSITTAKKFFGIQDENWNKMDASDHKAYLDEMLEHPDWNQKKGMVPDAPMKKNWHELALKRMLREAAERDVDYLSWTTGEQQADRYDMSKQVKSIEIPTVKKDSRSVRIDSESGTSFKMMVSDDGVVDGYGSASQFTGKTLDEVVGKEIAEKIMKLESPTTLKGENLKVGGEGMKGFYDKMIPRYLNKYAKKWGSKIERIGLGDSEFIVIENDNPRLPWKAQSQKTKDLWFAYDSKAKAQAQADKRNNSVTGTQLAIPITDKMKASVTGEGQPLFSLKRDSEVKRGLKTHLVPISTRLKRIDNSITQKVNRYAHDILVVSNHYRNKAHSFLSKYSKIDKADKNKLDLALKNRDTKTRDAILKKHGMVAEYRKVELILDDLFQEAKKAGYEIGYLDNYYPRVLKDKEGFLYKMRGDGASADFKQAIYEAERKKGGPLDSEELTKLADSFLKGYTTPNKLTNKTPRNFKEREIEELGEDINSFYAPSQEALLSYIDEVTEAIAKQKFFGKYISLDESTRRLDLDNSIGSLTANLFKEGKITAPQVDEVRDVLTAMMNPGKMGKLGKTYRNLEYIDTMGQFTSMLTQLQDPAFSAHRAGIIRTLNEFPRAFMTNLPVLGKAIGKDRIRMQDIGIEKIAQEFSDITGSAKAVETVFKLTGLTMIDRVGKETLINAAYKKAVSEAKKNKKFLYNKLEPIFGDETKSVIMDLQKGRMSDNVRYYLFSEVAEVQPISVSQMPQKYHDFGNGKIFYMLKSFYIKQLDTIIRTTVDDFKGAKGAKEKALQIGRMARLYGSLVALGVGADALKDLLLGREIHWDDKAVDNLLKLVSWSKFHSWKLREEGPLSAAVRQVIPPAKLPEAITKDIVKAYKGKFTLPNAEFINSIPLAGKLWYWWYGKGAEKNIKRSRNKIFEEINDLNLVEKKIKEMYKSNPQKARELRENNLEVKNIKRLKMLRKRWNELQEKIDNETDKDKIKEYREQQRKIETLV